MMFDFLIPYIHLIVYFLVLLIVLYTKTLIVEKAKIRALRSKNRVLTEETEEIKSRYIKEIEGIKKDHQLDIEKRKHQYESKKEQYIQFFKLLDDFNAKSIVEMQEKFIPIINEFNLNYLDAATQKNKKGETNATNVFSEKSLKLMLDANKELTRIKQETNTIRIIASDSILKTLDLLELAYDKCFEVSSKMLTDLQVQMMNNDQEGMMKSQRDIRAAGNVILKYRSELIQQMRIELNEI